MSQCWYCGNLFELASVFRKILLVVQNFNIALKGGELILVTLMMCSSPAISSLIEIIRAEEDYFAFERTKGLPTQILASESGFTVYTGLQANICSFDVDVKKR